MPTRTPLPADTADHPGDPGSTTSRGQGGASPSTADTDYATETARILQERRRLGLLHLHRALTSPRPR